MARNAEIYIDWTGSFRRDPAQPRGPTSDPLDRTLLRAYDFDCNEHLPQFPPASGGASKAGRASVSNACSFDIVQANGNPEYSYVNLCPRNKEKAGSDTSVTIDWFSEAPGAGHEPVRSWASQIEATPLNNASFQVDRDRIQATIDVQAKRLNAFMGLATFQMNAIRETYRRW